MPTSPQPLKRPTADFPQPCRISAREFRVQIGGEQTCSCKTSHELCVHILFVARLPLPPGIPHASPELCLVSHRYIVGQIVTFSSAQSTEVHKGQDSFFPTKDGPGG